VAPLRDPAGGVLLDEPLANIDRETTGLLKTVIASLPAQGTTVVMTTHDPDHPGRLNGESIFLKGGRHVLQSLR
jgi:tungstate transport system ATP-binding protein